MAGAESAEVSPTLGQRAVSAALWMVIAQVAVNLLRLGGNLVSARFLDSDAYGLMAIVMTINVGLIMLSDVGIDNSVIYDDRGDDERFLRTAFSLQFLRGVVLWVVALLLTYPVVVFYQEPRFAALLPVVCFQSFLAGFTSMKAPWNRRKVRQMKELAFLEIGTQAAAFIIIVGLAWWLRSVWALAIGSLAHTFAKVAFGHLLLDGPRDGFAWDRDGVRRVINYGRWIFVSTFVTFFSLRFDVFALGKLAGIETLGLYNMALMLSSTLTVIGFQTTQSVLFPALSEARRTRDPEILRQTFERSRRIVLPVGLWAVTALTYLGPAFFHYLYRDQFEDAGWMLQLQMIFTWFVFLSEAWFRVLMAVDDNKSMAFANITRLVAAIVLGPLGHAVGGVPGFIVGMGLASLCAHAWVHLSLIRNGLPALRLDVTYTLIAVPLLLLGALGPDLLAGVLGWDRMLISVGLSLLVGIPFTVGLGLFLRRNVHAARHAVAQVGTGAPPPPEG